jgi:hypothetical protein
MANPVLGSFQKSKTFFVRSGQHSHRHLIIDLYRLRQLFSGNLSRRRNLLSHGGYWACVDDIHHPIAGHKFLKPLCWHKNPSRLGWMTAWLS